MLGRGFRWLRTEIPFVLLALAFVVAGGYLFFAPGHWRRATVLIAAALLAATVVRATLTDQQAGMLAVRGRVRDTLCFLALGGVMLGVAVRLH